MAPVQHRVFVQSVRESFLLPHGFILCLIISTGGGEAIPGHMAAGTGTGSRGGAGIHAITGVPGSRGRMTGVHSSETYRSLPHTHAYVRHTDHTTTVR